MNNVKFDVSFQNIYKIECLSFMDQQKNIQTHKVYFKEQVFCPSIR